VRIIVAGEQISFFERFGYVELESFFSEKESDILLSAVVDEVERRRKKTPSDSFDDPSLLYGYDLALSSEKVQKELFSLRLARAAFAFVRKKPLRYAFDCLWKIPDVSLHSTIDTISSVTPLMISVVIALEDQAEKEVISPVPFEYSSLPQHKGSVAFIASQTLFQTQTSFPGRYLILAYSSAKPVYRLHPTDSHTHFLKRYGYVFGDQLQETTHPILFR
jgi:hypothetical protein